jgi:hypothetical protein
MTRVANRSQEAQRTVRRKRRARGTKQGRSTSSRHPAPGRPREGDDGPEAGPGSGPSTKSASEHSSARQPSVPARERDQLPRARVGARWAEGAPLAGPLSGFPSSSLADMEHGREQAGLTRLVKLQLTV